MNKLPGEPEFRGVKSNSSGAQTEKENRSSGEEKVKKLGSEASKFEMLEFSPD